MDEKAVEQPAVERAPAPQPQENPAEVERAKREEFMAKPATERREIKAKRAIGEKVNVPGHNNAEAEITEIMQQQDGSLKYALQFQDQNNDTHRGWFAEDEFTTKQ